MNEEVKYTVFDTPQELVSRSIETYLHHKPSPWEECHRGDVWDEKKLEVLCSGANTWSE